MPHFLQVGQLEIFLPKIAYYTVFFVCAQVHLPKIMWQSEFFYLNSFQIEYEILLEDWNMYLFIYSREEVFKFSFSEKNKSYHSKCDNAYWISLNIFHYYKSEFFVKFASGFQCRQFVWQRLKLWIIAKTVIFIMIIVQNERKKLWFQMVYKHRNQNWG